MDPQAKALINALLREGIPVLKEYALTSVKEKSTQRSIELNKELIDKQLLLLRTPDPGSAAPEQSGLVAPVPVVKLPSPKEVDGRATWQLLHTRARYFPAQPTQDEQDAMQSFIRATISTLSCPKCAMHGLAYIEEHPVDTSSRQALVAWVCEFHDAVNARTGKPLHGCAV